MRRVRLALLSASLNMPLIAAPTIALAQQSEPLPATLVAAKPIDMLPVAHQDRFTFNDAINSSTEPGSFARVRRVGDRPVFLATTPKGSTNQYGIRAQWVLNGSIAEGDVLLVRLLARAITARQETGEAEGLIYAEGGSGSTATRDATQSFSVGPDWTSIVVPFVVQGHRSPGTERLSIAFANLPQSIEFAQIEVLNFGKRVPLSTLPVTRFTYAGREAEASWRREALARIEATRTAPMSIRVLDRKGRPVQGARVKAVLTRSEFLWGSAVAAEHIMANGPDGDRYRAKVTQMFDTVVFDNNLKWPRWRNPTARKQTLAALDWLEERGKRIKGHTLVWPAWKFSPRDIASDPQRGKRIGSLVSDHITNITNATKGRLIGWDVVNEAIHEQDYWKHLSPETAAEWFNLARTYDPNMQLTFNEYGMLNRSSSPMMISQVLNFTRMLQSKGAKVDVIGVQAHVGQTPRPPAAVLSDLDLLAADGHQVQITEFDFNTPDRVLQADYTRDFLIALYSHKAVTGFLQWGFWERAHWKPDAAMFAADWSEKPNAKVWRDYVLGRWKTRINAETNADGLVSVRGHRGWYKITAEGVAGTSTVTDWRLNNDSREIRIVLQ